jgi:cytochrome P450
MTDATPEITITTYEEAKDAYRQKDLRQALYDAGEVVMADVLVNLHGDEHRDRRRLENRLFRRETFERYERELFPPIIDATLRLTSTPVGPNWSTSATS